MEQDVLVSGKIVLVRLGKLGHAAIDGKSCVVGHEHAGEKPCIILFVNRVDEMVIVVPLTTHPRRYCVQLERFDGVRERSHALVGQIRAILVKRIVSFLAPDARITENAMQRILSRVRKVLLNN